MNISIICEYNPFHKGHLRQINAIRELYGDSVIVSLMSGNFVQRGDIALFPKNVRAESAVASGADLVLELPYPYSSGSAEYFARAAVSILNDMKTIDCLCFGSECGNLEHLDTIAERLLSADFTDKLNALLTAHRSDNVSFNKVRENLYKSTYNADFVIMPNDILAVEYLKALKILGGKIKPLIIKRIGGYSASRSRDAYNCGNYDLFREMIPAEAVKIYETNTNTASLDNLERYILTTFRQMPVERLREFADITDGMDYRIKKAAANATSLDMFLDSCKTKKYSNSKIHRMILNCLLNTTEKMLKAKPLYTNILALNNKGAAFLKTVKTSDISLITKPSYYNRCSHDVILQYSHALNADTLYTAALNNLQSADYFMKMSPVLIN
jgi:predicted nucleotidyltransferase